jgi:hypothetical protein
MKILILICLILKICCESEIVPNDFWESKFQRNIIFHQEGCPNGTVLCRNKKPHPDEIRICYDIICSPILLEPPTCIENLNCLLTNKEWEKQEEEKKEKERIKNDKEKEERYNDFCLPKDYITPSDWSQYSKMYHYYQKDIRVCGNIFIQNINILKEIETLKMNNQELKKLLLKLQDDITNKIDRFNLQALEETKKRLTEAECGW